jgi:hypothetical protein
MDQEVDREDDGPDSAAPAAPRPNGRRRAVMPASSGDPVRSHGKFKAWKLCALALASFAAGALLTARLTHLQEAKADSNRVFELMVYHTEPGKVPALESVFKDLSKLQAKHGLEVVGYWVPNGDSPAWKDTFVYLVAHPSQEDATKNWDALHADPAFLPYRKAAVPLIAKTGGEFQVDEVFMRPTDFSAMK